MALATMAAPPSTGGLNTIDDLYKIINGTSTTTAGGGATTTTEGGVTTKSESTSISQEGLNAMLKEALGSTTGLAAVSSGARAAGGYNSTTTTLLTNDLLARVSGQVAQTNKTVNTSVVTPTTSTVVNNAPKTSTVGGVTAKGTAAVLGSLATGSVLGKIFDKGTDAVINNMVSSGVKAVGKKSGITDSIQNALGIDSGTNPSSVNAVNGFDLQSDLATKAGSNAAENVAGQQVAENVAATNFGDGTIGATGDALFGDAGTSAATTIAGDAVGSVASNAVAGDAVGNAAFGNGAIGGTGDALFGNIGDGTIGFDGAMGGLDATGGVAFGDGVIGAAGDALFGDAAGAAVGAAGDAAGAAVIGDAVVAGAAESFGLGDIIAAAIVGWIICTELVNQKRMPMRFYISGAKVFLAYPEHVKEGYYLWAKPSVAHLKKHPNSLYSKFLCAIFNWRAENIAAHAGVKGARKLWKGAGVTVTLWPICWVLGNTVCRLFSIKYQNQGVKNG